MLPVQDLAESDVTSLPYKPSYLVSAHRMYKNEAECNNLKPSQTSNFMACHNFNIRGQEIDVYCDEF